MGRSGAGEHGRATARLRAGGLAGVVVAVHVEEFALLLASLSKSEIADRLGVSPGTVHGRTRRVYEAAGVDTRAKLMAKFVRRPRLDDAA